jgi:exo-beta-1,3-glucanase (GH17 family)
VNAYTDVPAAAPASQPTPAYAAPPAYSAPAAAAPSAAAPASGSPGVGVILNGKQWAMTYTPYDTTGACKDAPSVLADLNDIKAKGFTTVRLYGTDCSGLANVGTQAKAVGLKVILGVFIKNDGIEAARPQIAEIVAWGNAGNWDCVVLLVVGNEAVSGHGIDAGALAAFVADGKKALVAAGQSGIPVTTTEIVSTFGQYKDIFCPVIDVTACNIQAFFDGKVVAANAGDFVLSQLAQVQSFCPGKAYYNLESGWPSGGGDNGASVASPDAQRAAIADISAKAGDKSVIFSYKDDGWKAPGIEQHFGCSSWF